MYNVELHNFYRSPNNAQIAEVKNWLTCNWWGYKTVSKVFRWRSF
jgi:hypothetical protein